MQLCIRLLTCICVLVLMCVFEFSYSLGCVFNDVFMFFAFIFFLCVWSPHLYSLQLSLDGKRLYVTSSLFSPWDKQFYPDMCSKVGGIHISELELPNALFKMPNTDGYIQIL